MWSGWRCSVPVSYTHLDVYKRQIFLTYGDIPAAEHQERFETGALGQFQQLQLDLAIPDERRHAEPVVDLILSLIHI